MLIPILSWVVSSTAAEELIVPGERIGSIDPSTSETEISEERLSEARHRGEAIAELLDTVAGARALDFGGPVSARKLTIRGGAPSQLLTIVDGVVLGSPFASGVDLGAFHPEAVGSLRVLRGGQGALYGDGALTGVLVLESRKPKDGIAASGSLVGGSFGTLGVGGNVAFDPVSLSASYEQTQGGFEYADRAFGLEEVERTRINNDARRGSIGVAASQELGTNRVHVIAAGGHRRAGVPGFISDEHAQARESQWNGHARIAVDHPLSSGVLSLGIGAAFLSLGYEDPEVGIESNSAFVVTSADASGEVALPADQTLRAQARVGGELVRSTEHGEPSRFFWSLALSDELELGDFTLFGAARASGVTAQDIEVLPRAGVRWAVARGVSLHLGIGRSLRTPTIDELYRPSEAGFSGNEELIAETAWEAELGGTVATEWVSAGAAVFARNISDVILYVNRNAFEVRPENLGDARALGGELEVSAGGPIGPVRLGAEGSLGLLLSELVETGERLPTQPVLNFASQVDIGIDPVTVFGAVRWVGSTSTRVGSDREETRVPAALRLDAGIEFEVQEWLGIAARATNLLDDRGLQSVNKIPLPGRAFFVTLSAETL